MGSNLKDMTGMVFGDLKVIERAPRGVLDRGSAHWVCECSCGNYVTARRDKLLEGRSHCGCKKPPKPEPIIKEPARRGRPPKEKSVEEPEQKEIPKPAAKAPTPRPRPFTIPQPKAGKAYGFTVTSKCKHCKKVFEHQKGQWGWNIGSDLFCTYRCMREEEAITRGERNA